MNDTCFVAFRCPAYDKTIRWTVLSTEENCHENSVFYSEVYLQDARGVFYFYQYTDLNTPDIVQ